MAHIEPRQAAPLADVKNLWPESLERLQVGESRRLAGTVEQQQECRPKMAEALGHGHGLVGELDRLLVAAQRSVLVYDECLHAAQIPQCAFTVEHLRRAQTGRNA